jgi:hypothetical protein
VTEARSEPQRARQSDTNCNVKFASSPVLPTHNATHNKDDLHVPRRTYAAVRDLQVVECIGQPHSEKAGVGDLTTSLATIISSR